MAEYSYQEAVEILRSNPNNKLLVEQCYLDRDNIKAAQRFFNSEEFQSVISYLKLGSKREKLKILDLGCGNGIASYSFAQLGHQVSAMDPDMSNDVGLGAVARLTGKLTPGIINTYQGFAEQLPFSDQYFDIIYCRQALHHFKDLKGALIECSRVLKPGGLLFATREHVVDDEIQLHYFLQNHDLHKYHGEENAYPLSTYLNAFSSAGFNIKKCMAPYDTVINHYPVTNMELKNNMLVALSKRFGKASNIIIKLPFVFIVYRKYLSYKYKYPGRLYSFLCVKD